MSESEQDAIIGRVLREYRDAKKQLAALGAEAERIGNDLTGIGQALRMNHSLSTPAGFDRFNRDDFPTVSQLEKLEAEINATSQTKERLAKHLRDAGYDLPKD